MFRSLVAAALALTVSFAATPDRAKADDGNIAAGVIFGAIIGGTIAVLADRDGKKDYRHSHSSGNRVYHRPQPRYYGHRHDRRYYKDRRDYRAERRYYKDRRDYRADRRFDRREERRIDRKVDRRVEQRLDRREDRRVERKVERRLDRKAERREDRFKRERDRAGRTDSRVARDIANRRAFIISQNGRGTGNDNVGGD